MSRLRPNAFLPLCLLLGGTVAAADFGPGLAAVTTAQGDVTVRSENGDTAYPGLHAELSIHATRIATAENSRLALVLSNGIGWTLDPSTAVEVLEFRQRPFESGRESLHAEPSISKLHLHLERGRIALAHPAPSPLSDLRISCREGELRFHKGRCVVTIDEAGTRIFTQEGSMTFIYPDGTNREFLAAGSALLISPQSAARGEVALREDAVPRDEAIAALAAAARKARMRVLFRAEAGGIHAAYVTPAKPAADTAVPSE